MTWVLELCTDEEWTEPVPVRADRRSGREQAGEPVPGAVAVRAGAADGRSGGEVRAWVINTEDGDCRTVWRRWAERFDSTGLWPVISAPVDRLFLSGELSADVTPTDASVVLASSWAGTQLVTPDGTRLPHPPWPGLAAASGVPTDRVVVPALPRFNGSVVLVPADRPADSIARLGWYGACNWFLTGADVAGVLRSWEDRFGAYVVGVGGADLDLVVTRPPEDDDQCRALADEHFAFCPDNFFPQVLPPEPAVISPEQYARSLLGERRWHFWWD